MLSLLNVLAGEGAGQQPTLPLVHHLPLERLMAAHGRRGHQSAEVVRARRPHPTQLERMAVRRDTGRSWT